jgi:acyl-CoA reductase-like NAD-dependent aldehyde dehydrogenase
VVAAITPWNVPVGMLVLKVAPALFAGNTVVAKPAPTTPLTTCLIGELWNGILPPGAFNVICDDNDLGGALTSHPGVAKIGFTGSTATGVKVMSSAAATLKRLTLELGGNDAALVLDDVDPVEAARRVYPAAMTNAGQICLAAKRVFVPARMYDVFCQELARLAQAAVVGDGLDPATTMGPLQNAAQFKRALVLGISFDRPSCGTYPTARAWCARSSSVPSCPCSPTTISTTPSPAQTRASMASEGRFGDAISTAPTESPRASNLGPSGSTNT